MKNKKQQIGVFGLGAIGSVIAFELLKDEASNEVHFYSRTPKESIRLIRDNKKELRTIAMPNPPFDGVDLDWLIVCIKEHHYAEALSLFSGIIGPETKVAVIRNGLRLKEPFLNFTEDAKILECSIDCPSQMLENGYYEVLKNPIITVPAGALAMQFAELFSHTTAEIKPVNDFKTESWKKVCESSALGAILCLSGETCWVFEDEKMRNLYLQILAEGVLVAKKDGALIGANFMDEMLNKLRAYPKTKGSSMLTDRKNGQPIELGAKNKLITDIGALYHVATPLNSLIVTLLNPTNRKKPF